MCIKHKTDKQTNIESQNRHTKKCNKGAEKEQGRPHEAVPRAQGDEGEQRDKELQQAGPPRLLHPLECQILQ